MPLTFSVKTQVYSNGEELYSETIADSCRDSWVSSLRRNVFYVFEAETLENCKTTCSLAARMTRAQASPSGLLAEVVRWYPENTLHVSSSGDMFEQDLVRFEIAGPGLLPIGAAWWLVLIARLLNQQSQASASATTLEQLIANSNNWDKEMWYNAHDARDHIRLLSYFEKVRNPAHWFLYALSGPIQLANQEFVAESRRNRDYVPRYCSLGCCLVNAEERMSLGPLVENPFYTPAL